jgi:hypothetical protein
MDETDVIPRELCREHLAVLDVLRHAKNLFFWLAIVAVALHVVSWMIVRYTDTLNPHRPLLEYRSAAGGLTPPMPTAAQLTAAHRWEVALGSALALGGFVGRASTLVVTGVFIIALLVSLTARLGGAADLARACVWSLAALAMLVPWIRAARESAAMASAFHGLEELSRAYGGGTDAGGGLLPLVRFLICPILVAVFLLVAQLRFRRARAHIRAAPGARLPIHEV